MNYDNMMRKLQGYISCKIVLWGWEREVVCWGKKGKGAKLHHFRGKPYPNLSLIITFKDKSRLPTL